MSKTKFKVGMKVYDEVVSPGVEGKVIAIDSSSRYPIIVEFGPKVLGYTPHGCYYIILTPTLSTTPYTVKLNGFTQPMELPEKGQVVWVRNSEEFSWAIRHFVEYDASKKQPFGCSALVDMITASYWKFLTTENPYTK